MTNRTATRIVLPFSFFTDDDPAKAAVYEIDPETDDGMEHLAVALTPEDYADMGEPECITVTVEAGDLLNG